MQTVRLRNPCLVGLLVFVCGFLPIPLKAAPATASPAPAHPARAFSVGQQVEYKSLNKWAPAKVEEVGRRNWLCLSTDDGQRFWVESWAVRVVGSIYDIDRMGGTVHLTNPGGPPPDTQFGPPPTGSGDPFAVVAAEDRPPTAEQLEKEAIAVSTASLPEAPAGGALPSPLTPPAPAGEYAVWMVRGTEDRLATICTGAGAQKLALAATEGKFGRHTQIVRVSLQTRQQVDIRSLPLGDLKLLAFASDGDVLLTTNQTGARLQVWQWNAKGGYKLLSNLRFGTLDRSVLFAALLDGQRAVIELNDGLVCLVDLAKKQLVSGIKGAPAANLFVHPAGQLLGVIAAGKAMILRSNDLSVAASFPDAAGVSNVAIDPTGQFAAYLTATGSVQVMDIRQKQSIGSVAVGSAFGGRIDLVDDKFLVVDGSVVYEIKRGIPLWQYRIPPDSSFAQTLTGQFLLTINRNNKAGIGLVSIPDTVGRSALKSFDPSRFILQPGAPIKIDGNYAPFGADAQKAAANVEQVVKSAGMRVSPIDEPFHLTLAIAPGPIEARKYQTIGFGNSGPGGQLTTVQIPSNILTATLTFHGNAVWSQKLVFAAGGLLMQDPKRSIQDQANDAARPRAEALKSLALPSYLPENARPGTPATLGASDMQDKRFVPDPTSAALTKGAKAPGK